MEMILVVIMDSYAGNDYVAAFRCEEDARRRVAEDKNIEMRNLLASGYVVDEIDRGNFKEIYAPDTEIYYSWRIEQVELQ